MKESLGAGHGANDADFASPAGLAENRDVRRIAAKIGDVVVHPSQRGDYIKHSDVSGLRERLACNTAEVEVAKDIQAMIYRHDDDITPHCQMRSIVVRTGSHAHRKSAVQYP